MPYWKDNERAIAKQFNGTRVGVTGKATEDVSQEKFSIECKARKNFALYDWMKQAVHNCPDGKTPIVQLHIKNKSHKNDLIAMRLSDFQKLIEEK